MVYVIIYISTFKSYSLWIYLNVPQKFISGQNKFKIWSLQDKYSLENKP